MKFSFFLVAVLGDLKEVLGLFFFLAFFGPFFCDFLVSRVAGAQPLRMTFATAPEADQLLLGFSSFSSSCLPSFSLGLSFGISLPRPAHQG